MMQTADILRILQGYQTPITIMEVCGSHTAAIIKSGLRSLLSPAIRLVSGPGCPVCVTAGAYIDTLVDYARMPGHMVLSFGDMLRVRGTHQSLADAKATGASVDMFYSPLEAIARAKANPHLRFVVAAVGFETTAPVFAVLVRQILHENLGNIRLLTALKTMPPVLAHIARYESVDGFLCPGHVSAIIGAAPYHPLAAQYHKPCAIAGFEPEHILAALYDIITQRENGRFAVHNLYKAVVSDAPQAKAQQLIAQYFQPGDAYWRGIGVIEASGLYLQPAVAQLDAGSAIIAPDSFPPGCRCQDVILGRIMPTECPLFATACTPDSPIGACMVSAEGACGQWFTP